MFQRHLSINLKEWLVRPNRKPLILRGARQVGKTTLIRKLGEEFESFIEFNLEKDEVRSLFQGIGNARDLVQVLEAFSAKKIEAGKTLLFLDEIQNSIEAIQMLRYFHEEIPDLHVISAGSLLEVRMKKEGWSFPVGRVEFLWLYPATFREFLAALKEMPLLEMLDKVSAQKPLPQVLHEKTLDLLARYLLVGGMPAALQTYLETQSFLEVHRQHEILFTTLREDFQKYASRGESKYLKMLWDQIPYKMGQRVKYTAFGTPSNSISHAFDILHEAMLVERIYPTVHVRAPLVKKEKASPKILGLDIGLSLSVLKVTLLQVKERLLRSEYEGGLWETFIGQELLAQQIYDRGPLYFWIREEKGSSSELDFLFLNGEKLIPIEVKAGNQGSLKSLHQFLIRQQGNFALRFYQGPPQDESVSVVLPDQRKLQYRLLSLPLYLVGWIKTVS